MFRPNVITNWSACRCCGHGRRAGTHCAHPHVATPAAPQPVESIRSRHELCGPDGRWHVYIAATRTAA